MRNIIQMQDDVKGITTEELVKEVQNPSGAVPVYLLLGELQRREKIKAEFAGQQEPTQTVADQIIAEAIPTPPPMPMAGSPVPPGPGQAIPPANQVMPPPVANTNPNMLAPSGVGALPAPNVGQYAEGGVIGFQDGGFFEFNEGVGEAERTARAVRPEIQTAENYNASFDDFGLSQLLRGKKKGDYLPPGALSPLFKRMAKENPKKAGLMRLLSMPQMKWRLDQDYAQGGVVGFAPGGQTRITDPRDQKEPKQLGQGYWEQYLTEEVPKYWRDVYEEKVPESLRQTVEGVPQVAREQLEAVVESPVGQTVLDIPRVAGEQAEVVGEAAEAWPYPSGFQEAGEEMTYGQDVAGEGTGVTGDQYADPSVTVESRGIPGIDTPMKGIGSLINKIPGYSLYDIEGVDADALDETFEATGRGFQVAPKGIEGREDEPPFMDKVWEKAIAGSGWFGDWEWGDKTKDKKDDDKKKGDKAPPKPKPKVDKHWEEVAERMGVKKGQYHKLVEGQIASGGKSSYGDDKTLKDRTAEIEKMMHDMGIYDSKEDERAAKVADRIQREEARSAWNAVTMAGLSMMQGESQFALTNIGKGIEDGIGAYEKSEQKIADLEDKKLDLAEKKATRDRDKKIAALTLAVDIEKSNQTNMTNLLTASAKLENDIAIANANNIAKKVAAQIGADARVEASLVRASQYSIENFYSNFKANNPNLTPGTNAWDVKFSREYGNYLLNIQGQDPSLDIGGYQIESTTP